MIPENLMLDAVRLRQILFNLIGNAVKFTELGYIRVHARTGNEDKIRSKLDLYIDVEDTGIGIAKDQQVSIFKDFEQLEGQDVRKYGGTGLGLAISKRLTELMGGEISLVSEPGKGSTFTIHLKDVAIASIALPHEEPEKPGQQIRFLPASVLVADDIEDNRGLVRECFSDTELNILEAGNGQDAIKMAMEENLDLIIMDIRMPLMNGYEAAAHIKTFSSVPIIALTASVMQDEQDRIKSIHFDGYLRKPVLKADLLAELARFLPHDVIEHEAIEANQVDFTSEEWHALPDAYAELEKLEALCKQISKNNHMSEIKQFAESVLNIGHRYTIATVTEYADQMLTEIDSFDIAAIKLSLNNFPRLLAQLTVYRPNGVNQDHRH